MAIRFAGSTLVLALLLACGAAIANGDAAATATQAVASASAVTPAAATSLADMAADRAKAMVTIKFINKGDGDEQEVEVPGTLISADGLVLTSNFFFPDGGSPSEMKVLVGEDTQGVDAKFVARDSELGLAWVRTDAKPESAYAFIDFAKGTAAKMGDEIFAVRKMGKFFGQAPIVNEAKIAAVTVKPRTLLIPTNGMSMRGDIAVAVYSKAGEVVGLTSFIMPEQDEMGGSGNPMRGAENGMILTAKDVAEATTKAIESAASSTAEGKTEESKTDAAKAAGEAEAKPAEKKPE